MGTEPSFKVRPTIHSRSSIKYLLLPAELVDDVLEVIFRSLGIVALYGRLVMLVDQILVIFGRTWLDLRFGTTSFNTVIQACEIRQRGLRQSQIDGGVVSCRHGEGSSVAGWGGPEQNVVVRGAGLRGGNMGMGMRGYICENERWAVPWWPTKW